jgi:energy-coupling factor transporter ATP-binding protein EcfA2
MYARLAFSVAAHINPDVLLVDEVLSVGDSNFQQKCFDFLHNFVNSGRTTVFISHNMYATEQLCDRLVWLDRGQVRMIGNPSRVLEQYLNFLETSATTESIEEPLAGNDKIRILGVRLRDRDGTPLEVVKPGEDLVVSIDYEAEHRIEQPHFCVWISDTPAPTALFAANMMIDDGTPESIVGRGTVNCIFKELPLMPRAYYVWVEIWGADRSELLFKWRRLAGFRVVDELLLRRIDGHRGAVRFAKSHGPMRVPYEWDLSDAPVELQDVSRALATPRGIAIG